MGFGPAAVLGVVAAAHRPTGHRAGRRRRVRLEPERRRDRRRDGDRARLGRHEQRGVRHDRRPGAQALRHGLRLRVRGRRSARTRPTSPRWPAPAEPTASRSSTPAELEPALRAACASGPPDGHRCADAQHAGDDARRVGHRADLPGRPMRLTDGHDDRPIEGAGAGQAARAATWSTAITATTDRQRLRARRALDEAIGREAFPAMLLRLWRGDAATRCRGGPAGRVPGRRDRPRAAGPVRARGADHRVDPGDADECAGRRHPVVRRAARRRRDPRDADHRHACPPTASVEDVGRRGLRSGARGRPPAAGHRPSLARARPARRAAPRGRTEDHRRHAPRRPFGPSRARGACTSATRSPSTSTAPWPSR